MKAKDTRPTQEIEEVTMSVLLSALYFFLSTVIVIKSNNQYRLVVIHGKHLLVDVTYSTLRGARIAFQRLFGYKRIESEENKDEWSHFYPPDEKWLEEQLKYERDVSIYDDEKREARIRTKKQASYIAA
jgi:hypothetical protein